MIKGETSQPGQEFVATGSQERPTGGEAGTSSRRRRKRKQENPRRRRTEPPVEGSSGKEMMNMEAVQEEEGPTGEAQMDEVN